MNITIVRSNDMKSNDIYRSILDCIDGKTIIITKNFETEGNWRLQIFSSQGVTESEKKIVNLAPVFLSFHFLHVTDRNQDELMMLNFVGYKNLILDDVWSVYQNVNVSSWITAIKTANPDINFIGISETWGESYKTRIDLRISDIRTIASRKIRETLMHKQTNEDLPPSKTVHLCGIDLDSFKNELWPCSYSPTGAKIKDILYVGSDSFLESIRDEQKKEIKAYARYSKVIPLLSEAKRFIATCMLFSPTPIYGKRMAYLSSQLSDFIYKIESTTMIKESVDRLPQNWQINIRDQKSIIFCDCNKSVYLKPCVNLYIKPDFQNSVIKYSLENFGKGNHSVLCIEDQRIEVTKELLNGCKNIFLFGSNKYDSQLLKNIVECASCDMNIVMFVMKDTIDESNVLAAVNSLKDKFLTVLKHDLSS